MIRTMGKGGKGGYDADKNGPWIFKGKALYQLHLVKVSEAIKSVPSDLQLVSLFGYTLGGVYLARYSESPCGAFDELVVLGGLVWNKPLSCAWASRVYVNNEAARKHGVKTCGLPSRRADFNSAVVVGNGRSRNDDGNGDEKKKKKKQLRSLATILLPGFGSLQTTGTMNRNSNTNSSRTHHPWWRREEDEEHYHNQQQQHHHHHPHVVDVSESKNSKCCTMRLPMAPKKIVSPRIKMFLPSFSGRTKTCPELMKYSLEMNANVRVSKPIEMMDDDDNDENDAKKGKTNDVLTGVIKGKPVVCIAFENMHMSVGKPMRFDLV